MSNNGTGMDTPPNNTPSGAVTSQEAARKNPSQGRFKSGIGAKRPPTIVDKNKYGIRRETIIAPKKTKPKKV
jgi:hypothetical protein